MIRRVGSKIKRMLLGSKDVVQVTQEDELLYEENQQLNKILEQERYTRGEFKNSQFNFTFPDPDSFAFIYREMFHQHVYKFKSDNDSPFIIDGGANIGLSIVYFKELYPKSRILAFEPDKEIFNFLHQNVSLNTDNNDIELVAKGLWYEEGFISFKNEGADAGRISFESDTTEFKKVVEIETVRLSTYITSKVDFLKLDIEGAEVEVIKEIENKLYLVDNIFIEYHSFNNSEQKLNEILEILTKNNFRYYLDSPLRLQQNPFTNINTFISFDFLLNIYAIRQK